MCFTIQRQIALYIFFKNGFLLQISLEKEDPYTVTCSALGGSPKPEITAIIEDSEGNLVRTLEEVKAMVNDYETEEEEELTWNSPDSTLTRSFIYQPEEKDCGRFVKCLVNQGDVFNIDDTRELMVVYKPRDSVTDLSNPFSFQV